MEEEDRDKRSNAITTLQEVVNTFVASTEKMEEIQDSLAGLLLTIHENSMFQDFLNHEKIKALLETGPGDFEGTLTHCQGRACLMFHENLAIRAMKSYKAEIQETCTATNLKDPILHGINKTISPNAQDEVYLTKAMTRGLMG